jgi:hypothetical protein
MPDPSTLTLVLVAPARARLLRIIRLERIEGDDSDAHRRAELALSVRFVISLEVAPAGPNNPCLEPLRRFFRPFGYQDSYGVNRVAHRCVRAHPQPK